MPAGQVSTHETPQPNWSAYLQPTLGNGQVSLHMTCPEDTRFNLQVVDQSGKILLQKVIVCPAGTNEQQLQLTQFPDGIYFIYIAASNGSSTLRFLKQQ
ncbi:MAG: T9SS type A sorting domain-containing protein [Lewinellaceae bacterium]|nr:T9SS type A sorting domain-containing protein [Lewinellaceae bacterium]